MDIEPRRPLALIACKDQWLCQSFEMVFEQNGYAVERLASGKRALDVARRSTHDVVLLDEGLEDLGGIQVCRALRHDPLFDHSTPIVIITAHRIMSHSRVDAYSAGAWEYCSQPVDLETLFLKLGTFRRARQEVSVADSEHVVDIESGLFTSFGLQQMTGHVGARASRNHEALACVALSTGHSEQESSPSSSANGEWRGFAGVANVLRLQGRKSDVVVRLGNARLGILAPGTDAAGARLLVARLRRKLNEASLRATAGADLRLRAGICAVADFALANVNPQELLRRAELALDHISTSGGAEPILSFDDMPGARRPAVLL